MSRRNGWLGRSSSRGGRPIDGRRCQIRDGREESSMAEPFLDGQALTRRRGGGHIRELAHVIDKDETRPAQMDFVAGRQLPFVLQCVGIDARAVEPVESANPPALTVVINFALLSAAEIVLEDDAIGSAPDHPGSMADG